MRASLFWVAIGLLAGCGVFATAHKTGCEPADLAKLEAAYVSESTIACKLEGVHSTAECKAFPAIREKYKAEREAYVQCK